MKRRFYPTVIVVKGTHICTYIYIYTNVSYSLFQLITCTSSNSFVLNPAISYKMTQKMKQEKRLK